MRELRIGKKILEKRRVYNLGGREMGVLAGPNGIVVSRFPW
jgi:hypothetical protein